MKTKPFFILFTISTALISCTHQETPSAVSNPTEIVYKQTSDSLNVGDFVKIGNAVDTLTVEDPVTGSSVTYVIEQVGRVIEKK